MFKKMFKSELEYNSPAAERVAEIKRFVAGLSGNEAAAIAAALKAAIAGEFPGTPFDTACRRSGTFSALHQISIEAEKNRLPEFPGWEAVGDLRAFCRANSNDIDGAYEGAVDKFLQGRLSLQYRGVTAPPAAIVEDIADAMNVGYEERLGAFLGVAAAQVDRQVDRGSWRKDD